MFEQKRAGESCGTWTDARPGLRQWLFPTVLSVAASAVSLLASFVPGDFFVPCGDGCAHPGPGSCGDGCFHPGVGFVASFVPGIVRGRLCFP